MITNAQIEPRTQEILERVKGVFAAKGFDSASMQDLARAAGMSAGNFYNYFSSKQAIVEELVEWQVAEVRAEFELVMQAEDTQAAFRGLVRRRVEAKDACEGLLWVEIEAAAARRPEFARLLARLEDEITRNLVAILGRITSVPPAEAEARFSTPARLILMLVQGVSVRCAAAGDPERLAPDRQLGALVIRTIERLLEDIAREVTPAPEPERS